MTNQNTAMKKVVIENHEFNFVTPDLNDNLAISAFIKDLNVSFKYIDEENYTVQEGTLFLKMGDMSDFILFSSDFSSYPHFEEVVDAKNSCNAQIKTQGNKEAAPLHLVIPEQVNGKDVVLVERLEQLYDLEGVTHLYLPDSLQVIGVATFINTPLKSVHFGENLENIHRGAFRNCQLEDVSIPSSCWYIGNDAFRENQLNSVQLPEGVSHIGETAFKNNRIMKIDFPSSLHILMKGAFEGNLLERVDVSHTKISILEDEAFRNNKITSVVLGDNVGMLSNHCLASNKIEWLDLPQEMQVMQEFALDDNPIKDVRITKVLNQQLFITYSHSALLRITESIKKFSEKGMGLTNSEL